MVLCYCTKTVYESRLRPDRHLNPSRILPLCLAGTTGPLWIGLENPNAEDCDGASSCDGLVQHADGIPLLNFGPVVTFAATEPHAVIEWDAVAAAAKYRGEAGTAQHQYVIFSGIILILHHAIRCLMAELEGQ